MSEVLASFSVPLVVNKYKVKYKPFYMSLNNYTQLAKCPPARNQVKKNYHNLVKPVIEGLGKIDGPVKITYEIFAKDKRVFDIANVGSILDKFLSDALVDEGVLDDDNIYIIPRVEYIFAGIDRKNPRAEVTIIRDAI